jgi:glycosyltransferase involved in cell wall biosynthesis
MVVSHILNYNFKDMKLSIVIPSYKDKYNKNTVEDLLKNSELGDDLEIIVVQDGYSMPDEWIVKDPRVIYIKQGKNLGMRGSINAGVRVARGEFFMRLDEHCLFGKGYDRILTDTCQQNQVMTARRFFLDPEKWEVMPEKGHVDYEKLTIQNISETSRKFAGKPWKDRSEKRKEVMIDETEALQGSMWIANREFFLATVGELQTETFGPLIQDSVEVCMKYWKAGGKLMLNKKTWFAHKYRGFKRTHNNGSPENPAQCEKGYESALRLWEDYYLNELRPKWDKQYENEK